MTNVINHFHQAHPVAAAGRSLAWALCALLLLALTVPTASAQKLAITTDSDEARAYFEQSRDLLERGKFTESNEAMRKALEADPDFVRAIVARAGMVSPEAREKMLARGERSARNASEGERELLETATTYFGGDADEALEQIEELRERYPDDMQIVSIVSNVRYSRGEYEEAEDALRDALKNDPENGMYLNSLGYTLMAQERYDDAGDALQQYIEAFPDEANPYDSYGDLLMAMEKYEKAEKQYEKALKIEPDHTVAKNNLARAQIAQVNRSIEKGISDGDAEFMANLFTKSGQILPQSSPAVKGTDAIRAYWQGNFDLGARGMNLTTLEVENHGDTATELGTFEVSDGNGNELDRGKYIVIWKKVDGAWKLHRDIYNSDLAATEAVAADH